MNSEAMTPETRDFRAETRQLLDIVIHSLYTDRDIFVRELVSNASDALEKLQFVTVTEQEYHDKGLPFKIAIEVDKDAKTFTITDTGIGMTREELDENLGTIAHSGARAFLQALGEGARDNVHLIGQFGLGFYAAFMVANKVTVRSRSYRPEAAGHVWESDGEGSYTIAPADAVARGTRIVVELKDDAKEFADPERVKGIIRQYSNFVAFPIEVNGEQVNTIQAIWTRNRNEVDDEEYKAFYRFIANAHDEPLYRMTLQSDAPVQVNALLFVPSYNPEQVGMPRMQPGVNLYCRKVLIQQNAPELLPEYLRFLRGVVDSLDIPLSVSRERMQNSRLLARLRTVLTQRFIKFLGERAAKDDQYDVFWRNFGGYIKEGVATDNDNREKLADLLRFDSSAAQDDKLTSLAAYLERMPASQTAIYYLNGPSRAAVEHGPYMETFRERGVEVLYLYEPVDDFIMTTLGTYRDKPLVSADRADLDLPPAAEKADASEQPAASGGEGLDGEALDGFVAWLRVTLGERVGDVRASQRLVGSPACLVNPDAYMTTTMQRVMSQTHKDLGEMIPMVLEFNPRHAMIRRLAALQQRDAQSALARQAAETILDNARISAGLPADPRKLVERSYAVLEQALGASDDVPEDKPDQV